MKERKRETERGKRVTSLSSFFLFHSFSIRSHRYQLSDGTFYASSQFELRSTAESIVGAPLQVFANSASLLIYGTTAGQVFAVSNSRAGKVEWIANFTDPIASSPVCANGDESYASCKNAVILTVGGVLVSFDVQSGNVTW